MLQVHHNVGRVQPAPGEAQLQRAKRERIIPIMLEDDDDDDDDTTTSDTAPPGDRYNVTSLLVVAGDQRP